MPPKNQFGSERLMRSLMPGRTAMKSLRRAGDRARDDRNWSTAVEHYQAYLVEKPEDGPIWIQYGHVLKEDGRLQEAEAAYRRAAALNPSDPDARLHLAHLLKRQGRNPDAAATFAELLKLAPNAEAVRELEQTGFGFLATAAFDRRPAGLRAGGIFLELKDLFQYLSLHTTVTGITRVTLGLLNHILNEMAAGDSQRYHFVHQYGDGEGLLYIPRDKISNVVRAAMQEVPDIAAMQAMIADIRAKSSVFRLEAGDTYLIVGAFWEFVANPSWIGGMRQRDVKIGAYIYDLIPITHPQYCMQSLTDAFTVAFAETARLLDFALTISEFVAQEVKEFLRAHEVDLFPIIPVPLAHALQFENHAKTSPVVPTASKREYLAGIPFVLCVCTIEARKNHIYLFNIWQRMLQAGMDVPDLVFVGRPGWRVEALMDRIEDTRFLNGRLHILYGLSDDELTELYDRCLFTVFPSFVEGWGLPVGESLAHGKLCVASSTTSIPEVGGDSAIYVDPFDIENGFSIISDLIANPAKVAQREAHLKASFKPRSWTDVGHDFFAAVGELLADHPSAGAGRRNFAPSLSTASLFETARLGRLGTRGSAYVTNPERLIFAQGWRGVETSGTWMLDRRALAIVQTDCAPQTELIVVLEIGSSPWVGPQNILRISAGGGTAGEDYCRPLKHEATFWLKLGGRVDDAGMLRVEFDVSGSIQPAAGVAPVLVRLCSLGYAARSDLQSRVALLEKALLN